VDLVSKFPLQFPYLTVTYLASPVEDVVTVPQDEALLEAWLMQMTN
jgi:hypothetical protein